MRIKKKLFVFISLLCFYFISNAIAATKVVDLVVAYKTVNFTGKNTQAIAVNNQIPGPTLHFKEGDHVIINVYNHLNKGTSIHWHGILVPWQMDGVEGVSQKAIPPGQVFHYEFTLKQAGTYWYHAHTGLQEQEGLYGALIIDPKKPETYHYNKDFVVVLSDWMNTPADKVYANLKKDGDYYDPRFPLQPSLMQFISDYHNAITLQQRKHVVDAYAMMQHSRMSVYDISDVPYDAYLLNGHSNGQPWTAMVKVGDVVRLRFIGAGASAIFNVKIPNTTMKIVQVDGNNIQPYNVDHLTIAPGETYDVLVKIQKNMPYIIYAESIDTVGAAYGALLTQPNQFVDYQQVEPFPKPEPIMMSMAGMAMGNSMPMHHSQPSTMSNMPHAMMAMQDYQTTPGTQYQNLKSINKTNNPNQPVQIIKIELTGYMGRFIWFINGVPEYKAKPFIIEPGKYYRLVFINNTMMQHPMHIHGHWFILRNGHGAYDPLLHTINVPPGTTIVADVYADTNGQWFFHCHNLYHMVAGMAQVFQYNTIFDNSPANYTTPENPWMTAADYQHLIDHPMAHGAGFYFANNLDIGEDPYHNAQQITYYGLFGPDYNKLQLYTNEAEIEQGTLQNADMDIFYWHLLSQFWAIKGGMNYFYRPAGTPYWQPGIGIEGLMPYFIDINARFYSHDGSQKADIDLGRDTQVTRNFFIRLGIRPILATKTVAADEIGSGLNQLEYTVQPYYRVMPGVNVYLEYQYTQYYGATKNLVVADGDSAKQNLVLMGISVIF